MTDAEKRVAAKKFATEWKDKGYEKGQSQPFWISLLRYVFDVENPEQYITFEDQVHLDHTSFIDGIISETHVLIEQKSIDKDLRAPIKQSNGTPLTPFQQAKRYSADLPYSQRPRWIVTCNFKEFFVYDMEKPTGQPEKMLLSDLPTDYYRLQFLVDIDNSKIKKEMEVSIQAGELVGKLYDKILKQYRDPTNVDSLKSLNMLCVRLVFCLYAEDASIFGERNKFHSYLHSFAVKDVRRALIDLFRVLDTEENDRDPYMEKNLSSFPYVNGGLFSDENIEIPQFNEEIVNMLLCNASENFDWSEISPTIFGAVFESTLNPETRRSGGMHYTSIKNIHKIIEPLFLDALKSELDFIEAIPVDKTREKKLRDYQVKLARLRFLDPAAGSGNFLTETYLSLRRLENKVLQDLSYGQVRFGDVGGSSLIKVSISQFYGIEINDFAVTVAKTALWIAESQMMKETEDIIHMNLNFLPLKSYANIQEGNALRLDWESVIHKGELNYIMGNPPFVGGMMMSREQKNDLLEVLHDFNGVGELDYVSAWYKKALDYIKGTMIRVAFVSTNSICQGQQAVTLWKPLFENGAIIQFAYRTFIWDNEAKAKAHVHCIIVCFSLVNSDNKIIYDHDILHKVVNINSYLADAPNIFIESCSKPICDVPAMRFGNMPRDGGGFVLTDEERSELLKSEVLAEKWIRPYIGSYEFINKKSRWCLWLQGANPSEIAKCPTVIHRIESIKKFRESSIAAGTRIFAATPTLFCQIAQPNTDYIAIPKTSSEKRRYIPIGFLPPMVIASDLLFLIPDATLYHFGILTSNVHNAWMRTVCGRLKSDYRYAKDIVYNNFQWPHPTEKQKKNIEDTAQAILDARALYLDSSFAVLYDEVMMPPELRKAHQANDRATWEAYNKMWDINSEIDCVAALMKLYQQKVAERN